METTGLFNQPRLYFQAAARGGESLSVSANDGVPDRPTIHATPSVKAREKPFIQARKVLSDYEAFTTGTSHPVALH